MGPLSSLTAGAPNVATEGEVARSTRIARLVLVDALATSRGASTWQAAAPPFAEEMVVVDGAVGASAVGAGAARVFTFGALLRDRVGPAAGGSFGAGRPRRLRFRSYLRRRSRVRARCTLHHAPSKLVRQVGDHAASGQCTQRRRLGHSAGRVSIEQSLVGASARTHASTSPTVHCKQSTEESCGRLDSHLSRVRFA